MTTRFSILIPPAMSLEVKLQTLTKEFQKHQADLSSAVEARQRLDAQLSENELVKKVCDNSFRNEIASNFSTRNSLN